jgi:hypothetical protein
MSLSERARVTGSTLHGNMSSNHAVAHGEESQLIFFPGYDHFHPHFISSPFAREGMSVYITKSNTPITGSSFPLFHPLPCSVGLRLTGTEYWPYNPIPNICLYTRRSQSQNVALALEPSWTRNCHLVTFCSDNFTENEVAQEELNTGPTTPY